MEDSYFDCPALEKFNESIEKALKGNFSFHVGAATHYFTDAFVPVHQTMGESWWNCHNPFEERIDEKLERREKFWKVSQECYVYFPCERKGRVNRKCERGYYANIIFSYEDVVGLIEKTDEALTEKLNLTHDGDYSYLLEKKIDFLSLVLNKILNLFKILMGEFKR
jgi:hypothetical protein